jgi:predicted acylesterase/phospholipase RssA
MAAAKRKTATRKAAPGKSAAPKAAPKKPRARRAPRKAAPPGPPRIPRRLALALAGEWGNGAFLAGALDRLYRDGKLNEIAVVAGSGSGALAAALVALGKWDELRTVFLDLSTRRIARPRHGWLPRGAARFLLSTVSATPSLHVPEGLWTLVREHVDPEMLRAAPVEALFPAVDLHSGSVRTFSGHLDHGEELLSGIVAAASPPVALPPVRVGFLQYVDGTLAGHAPLRAVFGALRRPGAGEVDAVLALSTGMPRGAGAFRDIAQAAERGLELAAGARLDADVRGASLVNALLGLRDALGEKGFAAALEGLDPAARAEAERRIAARRLPIVPIHPGTPLASRGISCDPAANRAAFAAGAAAAADAL